jgi:hypothetical protein
LDFLQTKRTPTIALRIQKTALRKLKAMAAFHVSHEVPPVSCPHAQMEPQLRLPSKSTRRPKAMSQKMQMKISVGQWTISCAVGMSQRMASSMERPATASV